jgi:hypothetical protein
MCLYSSLQHYDPKETGGGKEQKSLNLISDSRIFFTQEYAPIAFWFVMQYIIRVHRYRITEESIYLKRKEKREREISLFI